MTDCPRARLGDFCTQDRSTVRAGDGTALRYIGLETIESGTGILLDGSLSKTPEVPQANSFRFGPEHVLYGKLRPYLNKVALPEFHGKCSTEIIPLRPTPELDRRYLAYFLRSASVVDQISKRTAGARMPRADMGFVLDLSIPLPKLSEQIRVIDLLNRAEGIVRLRREAQAKAAEIIPALFLDMFGDPATNPKGWPVVEFGTLLSGIDSGSSPKCHDKPRDPDEWGVLRLGAVSRCEYDESEHKTLPQGIAADPTIEVKEGDLLLARKNTAELVGASAYVWSTAGRQLLPDLIFRPRIADPDTLDPIYLWKLLTSESKRRALSRLATGSANSMPNISKERLRTLPIELPPHALQMRFASRVRDLRTLDLQQATALNRAEGAFRALLARAFRVEVHAAAA